MRKNLNKDLVLFFQDSWILNYPTHAVLDVVFRIPRRYPILCRETVLFATLNFIRLQIGKSILNLLWLNIKLLQTGGIKLASVVLAPNLLRIRTLVVDLVAGLDAGRGEQVQVGSRVELILIEHALLLIPNTRIFIQIWVYLAT